MAKLILTLSILATFWLSTECFSLFRSSDESSSYNCPNFVQTADFSKSSQLSKVQKKMIDDLWGISSPKLTRLGKSFRTEIFKLTKNKKSAVKNYALSTSQWIWAYLPQLDQNLNLCSYAQMVNATVAYLDSYECDAMLKAINDSITALGEAGGMHIYAGVVKSGCPLNGFGPVPTAGDSCFGDGFVYDFDRMWELHGSKYPASYKEVVYKMYTSSSKIDQVMALLATAALSEQMQIIENNYDAAMKYQLFAMATPGKLKKRCCSDFFSQIQTLGGQLGPETGRVLQLAIDSTDSKCSSE